MRARLIGGLPADLVGSLTGLTQGRFPVHAKARYADDVAERRTPSAGQEGHNAALPVDSSSARAASTSSPRPARRSIAVQDGQIVTHRQRAGGSATTSCCSDVYGNTYTYGHLGSVAQPTPCRSRRRSRSAAGRQELKLPRPTRSPPPPPAPATQAARAAVAKRRRRQGQRRPPPAAPPQSGARSACSPTRGAPRPSRPAARSSSSTPAARPRLHDLQELLHRGLRPQALRRHAQAAARRARRSSPARSSAASATRRPTTAPHMLFEIRPAGRGAPRIDPKPILDGWKLLESTADLPRRRQEPVLRPRRQGPDRSARSC